MSSIVVFILVVAITYIHDSLASFFEDSSAPGSDGLPHCLQSVRNLRDRAHVSSLTYVEKGDYSEDDHDPADASDSVSTGIASSA